MTPAAAESDRLSSWRAVSGSYGAGVELLVDPSQQNFSKHELQASGTVVFVLSNERLRIAQPTQVDHSESRVELAIVTMSAPFVMMALRSVLL